MPEELRAIDNNDIDNVKELIKEYDLTKVAPLTNGKDVLRLYECPLTYVTEETYNLLRVLYLMESTNKMYFEGNISEQPSWLIEAYEIFKKETYLLQKMEIERGK